MALDFPNKTPAKLSSVNVRSEKHGAELVPASDIRISIDAPNSILDKLDPNLKSSLYFAAEEPPEGTEEEFDAVEGHSNLPNLLFPKLEGPHKWDFKGAGYELIIDYGLGGDSDLIIHGCEVNNVSFLCKEGGTVELSFRVQVTKLDEKIAGKLAMLVQHSIEIFLHAPKAPPKEDLAGPVNPLPINADGSANKAAGPETPESAFEAAGQAS